ncbi:MAG: PAS domain S-box protein [Desulfobacterales bacterium]|nr:PAS domain S-box protein [Desulfobacterales bacterium]
MNSIRGKIIALIVFVCSITIIAGASILIYIDIVSFKRQIAEAGKVHAQLVAESCAAALEFNIPDHANDVLSTLEFVPGVIEAKIHDSSNELFASFKKQEKIRLSRRKIVYDEIDDGAFHAYFGKNALLIRGPIHLDDREIGRIMVKREIDLGRRILDRAVYVFGVSVCLILISAVLAQRFQRIISDPIVELSTTASRISGSRDYSPRIEIKESAEEVGALGREFNVMLDVIEKTISEMEETQRALSESEERFRSLVESANDWIWQTDEKNVYTYSSPRIKSLLGYEPEEILGRSPLDLMPPDEAERMAAEYDAIYKSARPIKSIEIINIHKDGREVILETSGLPVLDGSGRVLGYRGVDRDITVRKKSEEEVRGLRNLLQNIIDSMTAMIISVDPLARVIQWNKAAERAAGVSAREARGRALDEVIPRLEGQMENVRKAFDSREKQLDPMATRHENGEMRFEEIMVFPLSDGVEGAVIQVNDITERVRLEEMIIQSEKMLSVGGLAAGMAHEINNPLAGVMQNLAVVRNRLEGDLRANRGVAEMVGASMGAIHAYVKERGVDKMLDNIQESGSRAAEIVKDMLNFARKSEQAYSTQNLEQLLDKTVKLIENDYDMKKRYDFKQIEIVREYDSEKPYAPCEGGKIQQVFLNILKNGAEAMSENPSGNAPPRFILRSLREDDMARIEIEDNGPGMAESTQKRIFEPFFTTKPVGQGTGLGLSVSYFIITENHNGTLEVESIPGKGTKFILRLPLDGGKIK